MSEEDQNITILNYLKLLKEENIKERILEGLSKIPKIISPRFFYDRKGSELFEKITHLKEYYPSRAEKKMLAEAVNTFELELADFSIIELGSGDASKISLIFKQLSPEVLKTITYYPMDVSQSAITKSATNLSKKFSLKGIVGLVADFTQQMDKIPNDSKRLFCFFGSTIGNYSVERRKVLLERLGQQMKKGDYLLLGADLIKEKSILEAAYNDSKGVTAKFNKNVLSVVNSHLGSDFKEDDFKHIAFYNEAEDRIEMHLEALSSLKVNIEDAAAILIKKGEQIHTENSYKFDLQKLQAIGEMGSLKIKKFLMNKSKSFSLVLYER